MWETLVNYFRDSGFGQFQWPNGVMLCVGCLFIFLAIRHKFEPLLLVPIGFGILIGNIPYDSSKLSLGVYDGPVAEHDVAYVIGEEPVKIAVLDNSGAPVTLDLAPWSVVPEVHKLRARGWVAEGRAYMANTHERFSLPAKKLPPGGQGIVPVGQGRELLVCDALVIEGDRYPQRWSLEKQDAFNAGVFWWLFAGVGIGGFYPPLIFLGVGALTDFGPMLANPKTLLLGAAAQFGIFGALLGAMALGFSPGEAASIGIIGGADGPTAIFTCMKLSPHLLSAVALAAYSYMAMVPIIQPPIMKLLTTQEERRIRMGAPKPVDKRVKVFFPIVCFLVTAMIAPGALPLLGMLFFGNLLRECLVADRLAKTAQTTFIDIVTILLGVTVGAKTAAANFLTVQTVYIFVLGVVAFSVATASGLLVAKLMNALCKEKINPLIGAAGVSAVPMAARVVHSVGQKEDPQNYLLMHAMGPNVAGVIGSAVAAGVLLSKLG